MMIYLDHAATTPMLESAVLEMLPWINGRHYGNPSSLHTAGTYAHAEIEMRRAQVAKMISARDKSEIIFTSGGTEADNLALFGMYSHLRDTDRRKILTTPIEHHAILSQIDGAEDYGIYYVMAKVDENGIVDLEALENMLRYPSIGTPSYFGLASIMLANNETGVIQPMKEIVELCHSYDMLVHTDAVQAAGHMTIDVQELGVDMLSVSGHKFGAADGIGALYVRKEVRPFLMPQIVGGGQEGGMRAGTENVAAIVSMGEAARWDTVTRDWQYSMLESYRDYFLCGISDGFGGVSLEKCGVRVNCEEVPRLPNILSLTIDGVESESLLLMMDADGVCISAGSACSSGSPEPSHVLTAMGMSDTDAKHTVRVSVGYDTTPQIAQHAGELMAKNIKRIRKMNDMDIAV